MAHGHPDFTPGQKHEAKPLDPEHDIDAKQASMWLIVSAIVLFLVVWALVPVFTRARELKRTDPQQQISNTELPDAVTREHKFLNGDNPAKKSIDAVVDQLRK